MITNCVLRYVCCKTHFVQAISAFLENEVCNKIDKKFKDCFPIYNVRVRYGAMLFNATFNNMSVISWRSV